MEWKRFWVLTILWVMVCSIYVIKHESVHGQVAMYYGCENITYGFSWYDEHGGVLVPYTHTECLISETKMNDLTYLDGINEIVSSVVLTLLTLVYTLYVFKEE